MNWTDPTGLAWEIIDWHRPDPAGKRKRLELGAWNSDGRAFVPHERDGDVMIFEFGRIAYRDTSDRNLREQLRCAKRATAKAVERMDSGRSGSGESASPSTTDNTDSRTSE